MTAAIALHHRPHHSVPGPALHHAILVATLVALAVLVAAGWASVGLDHSDRFEISRCGAGSYGGGPAASAEVLSAMHAGTCVP